MGKETFRGLGLRRTSRPPATECKPTLREQRAIPLGVCRDPRGAGEVGAAAVHHGEDEPVAGLLSGLGQAAGLVGRLPAQAPGRHSPGSRLPAQK